MMKAVASAVSTDHMYVTWTAANGTQIKGVRTLTPDVLEALEQVDEHQIKVASSGDYEGFQDAMLTAIGVAESLSEESTQPGWLDMVLDKETMYKEEGATKIVFAKPEDSVIAGLREYYDEGGGKEDASWSDCGSSSGSEEDGEGDTIMSDTEYIDNLKKYTLDARTKKGVIRRLKDTPPPLPATRTTTLTPLPARKRPEPEPDSDPSDSTHDIERTAVKRQKKGRAPPAVAPHGEVLDAVREILNAQLKITTEIKTKSAPKVIEEFMKHTKITDAQKAGLWRATVAMQHGYGTGLIYATGLGKSLLMILIAWTAHTMGHSFLIITQPHLVLQIKREVAKWKKEFGFDESAFEHTIISSAAAPKVRHHPHLALVDEADKFGAVLPRWMNAGTKEGMVVCPVTATIGTNGRQSFFDLMAAPMKLDPSITSTLAKALSPEAIKGDKHLKALAHRLSFTDSWAVYKPMDRDTASEFGGIITILTLYGVRSKAQETMLELVEGGLGEMMQHWATNAITAGADVMRNSKLIARGADDSDGSAAYKRVLEKCAAVPRGPDESNEVYLKLIKELVQVYPGGFLAIADVQGAISQIVKTLRAAGITEKRIIVLDGTRTPKVRDAELTGAYKDWKDTGGYYVVASKGCGGAGLDGLQGGYVRGVWQHRLWCLVTFGPNWKSADELQEQGRLFRRGQKKRVTHVHFQLEDSKHSARAKDIRHTKDLEYEAITGIPPTVEEIDIDDLDTPLANLWINLSDVLAKTVVEQSLPSNEPLPSNNTPIATLVAALERHL